MVIESQLKELEVNLTKSTVFNNKIEISVLDTFNNTKTNCYLTSSQVDDLITHLARLRRML